MGEVIYLDEYLGLNKQAQDDKTYRELISMIPEFKYYYYILAYDEEGKTYNWDQSLNKFVEGGFSSYLNCEVYSPLQLLNYAVAFFFTEGFVELKLHEVIFDNDDAVIGESVIAEYHN